MMIEYKIYEGNSGVELSDVLYSKDKVVEKYKEIKNNYEKWYGSKTFEKYYDMRIKVTINPQGSPTLVVGSSQQNRRLFLWWFYWFGGI